MRSRQNLLCRCGMAVCGVAALLLVGCEGNSPSQVVQKPATQGPPPVEPAVPMQLRKRPPDAPIAREATPLPAVAAAPAIPPTPAIPATPLVPAAPVETATDEAAPTDTLGIGDAAPPLSIATWVTGDPLDGFAPGGVTVVEFWATWCGPCRTSMPHISELQGQYGDAVRFVGVTREDLEVVEEFLGQEQSDGKTWAEVIAYRLAIDESSVTNTAYMKAAGQNGIPCAFIVGKDGHVEWIGHPMQIDAPLEAIVNDSYDREAAVAQLATQQRLRGMQQQLFLLQREQKWDEALAVVTDLQEELGPVPGLMSLKLQFLSAAGQNEEASALRGELVESAWDEPQLLNELAWNTALDEESSPLDIEVALKAATRAAELTDHADGSILDTLARVYYEMGDLDAAIEWQEKAVTHSEGNASLEQTLEQYRSEKAPESDGAAEAAAAEVE